MIQTPTNDTRLLALLNDGNSPTVDEIATSLGITDRQVRRILNQLRDNGLPIQERFDQRSKRFYLLPEDQRRSTAAIELTEEEILALSVAAGAARAALASTPLGEPIRRAFGELLKKLGPEVRSFDSENQGVHWHFGDTPNVEVDPLIFKALAGAIEECRLTRIDYLTASTGEFTEGRRVEPYAMAVRGGSWMLVAYCRKRRRVLDFSLAGISRVLPTDDYFIRPAGFDLDRHYAGRFKTLSGDETYHVRLRVDPRKATYFQRKKYNPSQVVEQILPDGAIIVGYEVMGLEEIRSFIQSWGSGVVALEPPELVAKIREELGELMEKYRRKKDGTL